MRVLSRVSAAMVVAAGLVVATGPIADAAPVALHMSSDFLQPKDRVLKEKAVHAAGTGTWLWHAGDPMPELPPSTHGASRP